MGWIPSSQHPRIVPFQDWFSRNTPFGWGRDREWFAKLFVVDGAQDHGPGFGMGHFCEAFRKMQVLDLFYHYFSLFCILSGLVFRTFPFSISLPTHPHLSHGSRKQDYAGHTPPDGTRTHTAKKEPRPNFAPTQGKASR